MPGRSSRIYYLITIPPLGWYNPAIFLIKLNLLLSFGGWSKLFRSTVTYSGELASGKSISFKVFDIIGNMVRCYSGPATGSFIFDRNGLKNGVYFYEIKSENGQVRNGKVILQ